MIPLIAFVALLQDVQRDALVTEDGVYVMQEARYVCGPKVLKTAWSTGGDMLAIERLLKNGEREILAWSAATGAAKKVRTLKSANEKIAEMTFFAHSHLILAQSSDGSTLVQAFSLAGASPVTLFRGPDSEHPTVRVSPVAPLASLTFNRDRSFWWGLFDGAGHATEPILMPEIPKGSTLAVHFGRDGSGPHLQVWGRAGQGSSVRLQKVVRLDPEKGNVEMPTVEIDYGAQSLANPMRLDTRPLGLGPAVEIERQQVLLIKGKDEKVATTDGCNPSLAPRGAALAYEHLGNLFVRQILRMPLDEWRTKLAQAQMERAMAEARIVAEEIALAASFGRMPTVATWRIMLVGIRDKSLLDRFVYTFAGQPTTDMSTRELGYLATPVGRARVMGDYRVVWEPEAKPPAAFAQDPVARPRSLRA